MVNTVKQILYKHLWDMHDGESLFHEGKTPNGGISVCSLVKREALMKVYYEGWENGNLVRDDMNHAEAVTWLLSD